MDFEKELIKTYKTLKKINKKKIIFCIGNTTKIDRVNYFFMPIRLTADLAVFGIIIFKEKFAKIASKLLDGKVDYIMVDAEKKSLPRNSKNPGNIERTVRESLKKTKMLVYKGNDLTVHSIDQSLTYYFNKDIRGLGGKIVLIIGAGNIGSKLAQVLVERGAKVFIKRRNYKNSLLISKTLNLLIPKHTTEEVKAIKDEEKIYKYADIVIGANNGKPVITKKFVEKLKTGGIIVDVGKGTVENSAILTARKKNINIFRTDVTIPLVSLIESSIKTEEFSRYNFKIIKYKDYNLVPAGQLGLKNDIIVDSTEKLNSIYGICNGSGGFYKKLNENQKKIIKDIKKKYKIKY